VDVELKCKYHDGYHSSQVDFATIRLDYRKLSDGTIGPSITPGAPMGGTISGAHWRPEPPSDAASFVPLAGEVGGGACV
jgi:hypothetical protein